MSYTYPVPSPSDYPNDLAPATRSLSDSEVALTRNRSAVVLRLHTVSVKEGRPYWETFVITPRMAKHLARLLDGVVDDYLLSQPRGEGQSASR